MTIGEYFKRTEYTNAMLDVITDKLLDKTNAAFKSFNDWDGMAEACRTVITRNFSRPFVDRGTLAGLMGDVMTEYNRQPGNRWPPVWLKIKKELAIGGPTTTTVEQQARELREKEWADLEANDPEFGKIMRETRERDEKYNRGEFD